jgi:Domain of unknown function (DUF4062)
MTNQRINVFISSTSRDLAQYRLAVRDAVLAVDLLPIMMEDTSIPTVSALNHVLEKVDEGQIYIGIFAYRYGYVPQGSNVSITELEFNRATERQIPRLCFFIDETYPWPAKYIDDEPGRTKLQEFKKRIGSNLVVGKFTTPQSLQTQVATSLLNLREKTNLTFRRESYQMLEDIAGMDRTTKVQLFIKGEVAEFDNETLVNALKGMLGLDKDDIRILRVHEG